ncbi:MAG TPA: SGNH hydrolase domain-containing protein, partial [Hyphomicrobium sp.]|nr:SGNH hydrolase domain-containing protein [Hyphomicrobium sp.]
GLTAPRFDKVLKDTIETFTKRGIKVLLIGQIPTYGTLPVRCIGASVRDKVDAARCGMTRAAAETQLTRSNAALKRAAATLPGVAVSQPFDYMCQEMRCSPIADGTLLYKNGGHVNRFGAEYLRRFVEFPSLP